MDKNAILSSKSITKSSYRIGLFSLSRWHKLAFIWRLIFTFNKPLSPTYTYICMHKFRMKIWKATHKWNKHDWCVACSLSAWAIFVLSFSNLHSTIFRMPKSITCKRTVKFRCAENWNRFLVLEMLFDHLKEWYYLWIVAYRFLVIVLQEKSQNKITDSTKIQTLRIDFIVWTASLLSFIVYSLMR